MRTKCTISSNLFGCKIWLKIVDAIHRKKKQTVWAKWSVNKKKQHFFRRYILFVPLYLNVLIYWRNSIQNKKIRIAHWKRGASTKGKSSHAGCVCMCVRVFVYLFHFWGIAGNRFLTFSVTNDDMLQSYLDWLTDWLGWQEFCAMKKIQNTFLHELTRQQSIMNREVNRTLNMQGSFFDSSLFSLHFNDIEI